MPQIVSLSASRLLLLISFVSLCGASAAFAQDDNLLAPGVPLGTSLHDTVRVVPIEVKPLLIALPQAVSIGSDATGLDALITDQLALDLSLSGYFQMAPPESFDLIDLAKDGQTASTIDFNGWITTGADWLIKASYEPQGGGKAKLDIRVFDVHTGQQVELPNWKPSVVTEGSYRYAVHELVNDLIAYKTDGPQGPFGSVMLFAGSDTGNNRKVFALELGGKGADAQEIPRGINVMPTWGPKDTIYFSTFPDDAPITLRQYNREDKSVVEVADQAYSVDYCASKDLLAFVDHGDIYTMHPDGSDRHQLTHDGYEPADVSPAWGPGCSEMAFVSDRDGNQPQIFVMRADGSNQRRVTYLGNYNTSPDWSPNIKGADGSGSWIAFTARDEFAHFDVFVIRPDGSEIFRVTQDQGDNNEEPAWSPDGRYLVFQSTRDGSKEPRLYMARMDVRGAFQVRVSDGFGFKTPAWQR
jgi:TolB protein